MSIVGPEFQLLRTAAMHELAEFQAGTRSELLSSKEMAKRFGIPSVNAASTVLSQIGYTAERKDYERRIVAEGLKPSPTLAHWMGILSARGYVGKIGIVSLSDQEALPLDIFEQDVEYLFGTKVFKPERNPRPKECDTITSHFMNRQVTNFLGVLTSKSWFRTVEASHQWIFENNFEGDFVDGFCNLKGNPIYRTPGRGLFKLGKHTNEARQYFVSKFLLPLGITTAHPQKTSQGLEELVINDLADIKRLAEYIDLKDPKKRRELLQIISVPNLETLLINNWLKLGPAASRTGVDEQSIQGASSFSSSPYYRCFGSFKRVDHIGKSAQSYLSPQTRIELVDAEATFCMNLPFMEEKNRAHQLDELKQLGLIVAQADGYLLDLHANQHRLTTMGVKEEELKRMTTSFEKRKFAIFRQQSPRDAIAIARDLKRDILFFNLDTKRKIHTGISTETPLEQNDTLTQNITPLINQIAETAAFSIKPSVNDVEALIDLRNVCEWMLLRKKYDWSKTNQPNQYVDIIKGGPKPVLDTGTTAQQGIRILMNCSLDPSELDRHTVDALVNLRHNISLAIAV